ncbi:hypothetical protein EJ08DRAFT_700214 [Tothia fuscella]|uniref:Uncharacterized protein n=1 Tax=Tothia fuscella TaxID=1048955 RepID=A0A9P4NKM5_9PEZI|nr:hypothetical protein EJ08DRAFT_700214 [Tothia fuscella]
MRQQRPKNFNCTKLTLLGLLPIVIILGFRYLRPYEAPLEHYASPEDELPGKYMIRLRPSYSVEQHSAATGHNIQKHVYMSMMTVSNRIVYGAKDITPKILAAIRADRGCPVHLPGLLSVLVVGFKPIENLKGASTPREDPSHIFGKPVPHDNREYDPASPPEPESCGFNNPESSSYDPSSPPRP